MPFSGMQSGASGLGRRAEPVRHRAGARGCMPISFSSRSAIWLSLCRSRSCTSALTGAEAREATTVPWTDVAAYTVGPRDRDAACRRARRAKQVRIRERGIGEELRVGAPTIAVDHERRERAGIGGDLPVLPLTGSACTVVARLVDEQRTRYVGDTVRAHLVGEHSKRMRAAGGQRGVAAADHDEVAGRAQPDLGRQSCVRPQHRERAHRGEELLVRRRRQRHVGFVGRAPRPSRRSTPMRLSGAARPPDGRGTS